MPSDPSFPLGLPEWGSDVVAAMLRAFGIEYAALNPGASFRGIHDSLVNFGGNRMPEIIECVHEEIAVAIAHGYAATTGRPMAAIVHDIVGLQHASIAVYHAFVDRAPVLVLGGTGPMDASARRPWIDWLHTALVQGTSVRDFTRWDDQPASVAAIPKSFVRGFRVATAPPAGPVYLCYDVGLQEQRLAEPVAIPKPSDYPAPSRLQAEDQLLHETAQRLLSAERPVLLAEYAGRYAGASTALTSLAELLGTPVMGKAGRFSIASNHPLSIVQGGQDLIDAADAILAVEVVDLFGLFYTRPDRRPRPGPKVKAWLAHLTLGDLGIRAWSQDFQEITPLDLEIRADAGVALPRLLEICRERITEGQRTAARDRSARIAERTIAARQQALREARSAAGASPIALSHLALQLKEVLEPHRWTIAKGQLRGWLRRLLDVERPEQWIGISAAGGLGNGLGFALGVALAHRDDDIICVDVQGDGDLLYTPGALWTAAHHRLPLLVVVYNNRSYYNSEHHALQMAEERGRLASNAGVGTRLDDPAADFAALARSFGLYAEGPIADPADVRPALQRAVEVVRHERRLALVDVLCEND